MIVSEWSAEARLCKMNVPILAEYQAYQWLPEGELGFFLKEILDARGSGIDIKWPFLSVPG